MPPITQPAADPYRKIDTWERLCAHATDGTPGLAARCAEAKGDAWAHVPLPESRMVALMLALGEDPASPVARRAARGLLRELVAEADSAVPPPPVAVRESTEGSKARLAPANRERALRAIKWLGENDPAKWLARMPGPNSAVDYLAAAGPLMRGKRAFEFLAALGYPVVVPDRARIECLRRIGWLDHDGKELAEASAAMESIARGLGVEPVVFNLVVGAFSGAIASSVEAGPCRARPKCDKCPVTASCAFFAHMSKIDRAAPRSLRETVREEQRPRERLEAKGPRALSDEELLAILLRTGSGKANALDLAHSVMRHAGSVDRLEAMSVAELSKFEGLGRVKAITIKAALELARRLRTQSDSAQRPRLRNSRAIYDHLRPRFVNARREEFVVLLLNTKMELTRTVDVTTGILNGSLVHPREAFAEAVRDSAHAVVFAHNHPSGDPAPSRQDVAVTDTLAKAGQVLGIRVMDHIIIGNDRWYSFADEGKMPD